MALVAVGVGLAHWQETLTIETTVETGTWEVGGSPGFWENWDSHNTYTEAEIVGFLRPIGVPPGWLYGITDISQMEAVFAAGDDATMEEKFLRHYLDTRLNVEAGKLFSDTVHDFSSYDPGNYLGLGGLGTLEEIIGAIEDTYPGPDEDPPTEDQFELMKNICEAVNSLGI